MNPTSNKRKIFSSLALITICLSIGTLVFSYTKSTTGNKTPHSEKMLKISFSHDPATLDPRLGAEPVASTIHFALFEGLTRMNQHSTHELALANQISLSEDKTIYTFHLRDAYWSNGDPVIAEDIAYAWKTILLPDFPAPNANLLYPILNAEKVKKRELSPDNLGIEVVDDKTLKITLERPTPYFLDVTSFCVLAAIPSKIAKQNPKWAEKTGSHFICNGPFTLDSWQPTNKLVFKKNPFYWDHETVKLDTIQAIISPNEMTTLAMFEAGELDFMGSFCGEIQTEWIPSLNQKNRLDYTEFGATKIVCFNLSKFPFTNPSIRKAFGFAIDRKAIVENITQYKEIIATGYVPPIMKDGYNHQYFKDADIQQAKELLLTGLQELGLKHPSELGEIKYCYYNTGTDKKLAQIIQQQWQNSLGVQIKLEEYTFNSLLSKLNNKDYHVGQIMYLAQYNDQMNILDRFKIKTNLKNYPGWENPEYIRLLENSAFAENHKNRLAILEKAEQIMISEMPIVGLYHYGKITMKHPHVHNLFISPIGSLHFNYAYIGND